MIVGLCKSEFLEGYVLRTFGLDKDSLRYPQVRSWIGGVDIYFNDEETWQRVKESLGIYVYADRRIEMEEVVGELLREKRLKLAVAESCTAGLLSARLVNVPGSSDYFVGGFVVYSNELKTKLLSVEKELLEKYGAVSEEVCRAMCIGALEETDADITVAITGVAGPSASERKPAGLTYVGLCTDKDVHVERHMLNLSRNENRFLATQIALNLLRKYLLGVLK
ncbi:nicotinamide-nucleotide amidohydrolase family protein [Thermocrinis sp.]|uniref:CinA family protein n=1 Tax=Thermocrinis sp. TaxID=2024383 RepID=UPI002FDDFD41